MQSNIPEKTATFHLVCEDTNDLYRVMSGCGYRLFRHGSVEELVDAVEPDEGALLLSDAYPAPGPELTEVHKAKLDERGVRLFVEYPARCPGFDIGLPCSTRWERTVAASDLFSPSVARNRIFALHGCWYLPLTAGVEVSSHLVTARVAGYDTAVYGVPEDAVPVLVETADGMMVAATCLSRFVTARYAPAATWKHIWEAVLRRLVPHGTVPELRWTPVVRTSFGPDDPLPADAGKTALGRATHWFRSHALFSVDEHKGAVEGYESSIDHRGRQFPRTIVRGDCTAETGLVMAYDWHLTGNPDSRKVAFDIYDYIWRSEDFYQADPDSPAYGHTNWNVGNPVFYGDDNARVIMPSLAASRLLATDRWNDRILRCLLANYRTTGPGGFRRARLDLKRMVADRRPWMFYRDTAHTHIAPHYQAYLWATFLWAHTLTGFPGFLDKPKRAIRATMERFPSWQWTNGLTQEMARMLLPLAFLLRIEDTGEHRRWLTTIVDELKHDMVECGALRERMGSPELGRYPSPRSNQDYGTNEAAVIQENGDPACDLLYSAGFALLGLHEAAAATGSSDIAELEDGLVRFFERIQIRSDSHPFLDGAWMRSFDYKKWEYWGSSADLGWGAFSVETGWYSAWMTAVLAMRERGETLFHPGWDDGLRASFPAALVEMMAEKPFAPGSGSSAQGAAMPGAE